MTVTDIMRRSFATIKPDAPLLDAAHLLLETNQRGLPVVDQEGSLVGIVSEGDFLHRSELDIGAPAGNWLEELLGIEEDTPACRRMCASLIHEVMTHDPVCVDGESTVDEVVALMDARHIAQLPVVCGWHGIRGHWPRRIAGCRRPCVKFSKRGKRRSGGPNRTSP